MNNTLHTIAEKLKYFRLSQRLTQKEIADAASISTRTLQSFEKTGVLPTDKLILIAKFFNKNPMIFFSEESSNFVKEADYIYGAKGKIELLEKEVKDLNEMLGKAYIRITNLEEENERLMKELNNK